MDSQASTDEVQDDKQQGQADGVGSNHTHPAWRNGGGSLVGSDMCGERELSDARCQGGITLFTLMNTLLTLDRTDP